MAPKGCPTNKSAALFPVKPLFNKALTANYLPTTAEVTVKLGDHVKGAETVIARLAPPP